MRTNGEIIELWEDLEGPSERNEGGSELSDVDEGLNTNCALLLVNLENVDELGAGIG